MANWTKEGALIAVVGRIQTRNYENQQGQRVYVTEVVVEIPDFREATLLAQTVYTTKHKHLMLVMMVTVGGV